MHRWALFCATLAACASSPPSGSPSEDLAAHALRPGLPEAALVALARHGEVLAVDGDVALVCSEPAPATDADDAIPDCDAATIAGDGALAPLGRGGLLAAGRLDDRRLMLLTRERSLRLRAGDAEVEVARDVADPRLAPDRRAIAFTQLPPGAGVDPSTTGRLVLLDLDRGTRRVVTDHPLDSSPFPRPASDDVLFVSARTGLASLWLARPGQPARQLTNRGAREVGPGFVPVPGRELTWLDPRVAIYTATYDGVSTLWALDVDTGAAAPLAAGRRPQRATDGVIAIADGGVVAVAGARVAQRLAQSEVAP